MPRYRFDQIAINSTEKRKPTESDMATYIGLEHMDSHSLTVKRWGSDVPIIGDKLVMRKGDVLLGKRNAYLRRAAIAPFDGLFSAHGMVLKPKTDVVDKDFFPIFIASDYFFDEAIRISVGSLSPTINWKDLKDVEFNLPTLDEQRKLAKILWAIIKTTNSYQEMLEKQDLLIKSQFIEMFGNVKKTICLGDCSSIHSRIGWQALKKGEHLDNGEYLLITGTDFVNNSIDYSSCKYVSKQRYDMDPKIQLKDGDILVTKDGTIGKVAIVSDLPKPATLNSGIFVIRPGSQFDKDFIAYIFKGPMFTDFIEEAKTGSTIKHLNQEKLVKFAIPDVSFKEQKSFSKLSNQIDKSKFEIEKSLNNLKKIYEKVLRDNF